MTKSDQLFQQAQQHIPGGVNSPVRAFKGVGGTPIFSSAAKELIFLMQMANVISITLAPGGR